MSLFDIRGRRALVVGGTSGIGRDLALALAQAGADTVAVGRREAEVASVTREIAAHGVRTFPITCDASSAESVAGLRDFVQAEWEGLDILLYAAGITLKKPTLELTSEEWNSVMEVNVGGALRCCQAFHRLLSESAAPRVILIASLSSLVAFHQVAAYSASKAALLSLAKSLACEWAGEKICVNAIVPGVFVTDLNRELLNGTPRGQELLMRTPMKRFGDIAELRGAALFLASDAASFVTGSSIVVDGGFVASGVNR